MSVGSHIQQVLPLLLPNLTSSLKTTPHPLILGITGLQGSGKSTWAASLVRILSTHNIRAIRVSLDDFYRTHDGLIARRIKDPGNKLYATRGQPGTHDEKLATRFFDAMRRGENGVRVPRFDKSRFRGEGDRVEESEWEVVEERVDVIVFEGWCVGFQALEEDEVRRRWEEAKQAARRDDEGPESTHTLADHDIGHLLEVNKELRRYNETFMGPGNFDFLIHIDTERLRNVYKWRWEQEVKLVEEKGEGMGYEAVVRFVRGYMPAYELYLDGLRRGVLRGGRQIRVVLDGERKLLKVQVVDGKGTGGDIS
ncbi:P-loop containing nucleoside triphosphate hydrolase protein [Sporormia fimetaria CBS 119925]|uniref:P-loop containing nucleoside triphosphate hydrolase protein n=1 Tax=Sporormia fimetaria CBS 119925 TaxID=1340428 RepID=A0A6A6V820_9PLEO|nr:P-loop containing nucleoside triphosphate hydrolase protein [Sporormia fimetaria CBS 119925]